MANPWTKKNPAMSIFLSGANAWAGAVRGLWTKEARRQQTVAVSAGVKRMAGLWTAGLTSAAAPSGKKAKRRR